MSVIREILVEADIPEPAVHMLGRHAATTAQPGRLAAHAHGPSHEICYIARGVAHWWVEDEVHELTTGQLFITGPDERHGAVNAVMGPFVIYWMIVDLAERGLAAWDQAAGSLRRHWTRTAHAGAQMQDLFDGLLAEHRHDDALAAAQIHALVLEVLVASARACIAGPPAPVRTVSPAIRAVLTHMHTAIDAQEDVADWAAIADLAPSVFHPRFQAETGFTPAAYRNHLRVLRAQERLRAGPVSITRLAHDLGFPSSQYFATVFKRFTGLSPQQWRRGHQGHP